MFTWVYKYRYWDADKQEQAVSRDMFTMDAIRAGLGTAIVESGTRVPSERVDENGRMTLGSMSKTKESES
jgi:hypothetical protein